jgi:hypothetical protein
VAFVLVARKNKVGGWVCARVAGYGDMVIR